MFCLCLPCLPSRRRRTRHTFTWPDFSFSHSRSSINPRRTHSTFSLRSHKQPRISQHYRRHTVHAENTAHTQGMSFQPPPGPPPGKSPLPQSHIQWSGAESRSSEIAPNNPFRNAHASSSQGTHQSDELPPYQAPPGAPSYWQGDKKAGQDGPPPGYQGDTYQPPPGPPPTQNDSEPAPPPYDPWMAVPDTSLLPPPPSMSQERSPTANASDEDAFRGHEWCRRNPLWNPGPPNPENLERLRLGHLQLTPGPNNHQATIKSSGLGRTNVRTKRNATDSCFLSDIPLFFALPYQPHVQRPVTVYYELQVIGMGSGEGSEGIAIGLLAPPYPAFRLPGWHRASVAVHGDDGHRYCDNSYGGQEFTQIFRRGDVVGIGMTISPPMYHNADHRCKVFFTRNGTKESSWDLNEERDSEAPGGDLRGLAGHNDILAAVGSYGAVEFETRFRRQDWLFIPQT